MRNEIFAEMILKAQQAEITEHHIYKRLAEMSGDEHNSEILRNIAADEKSHYEFWADHTGKTIKPNRFKIFLYTLLARLMGFTFAIRLMERGEDLAQENYHVLAEEISAVRDIEEDENAHEEALIDMLEEEKLQYASSIVLGLNDALVELTGAIAGLTFALQNPQLVAVAALVTGISASLSMGGSEYLSTKTDDSAVKDPLRASVYTGVAYIFAVAILVLPFFVAGNSIYLALAWTLLNAVLIILGFTYYISVARNENFPRRFLEMVSISMGVALVSFGIGLLVRQVLGIDV